MIRYAAREIEMKTYQEKDKKSTPNFLRSIQKCKDKQRRI